MFYKILPLNCLGKVFFGHVPSLDEANELKKNVTNIWNLLMEFSDVLEYEKDIFSNVLNTPIQDYQAPEPGSNFMLNLEQICSKLEAGENVFVHCFGGRGRTGMALAALLIKINKMYAEDALKLTHEVCGGPETDDQKNFIKCTFAV